MGMFGHTLCNPINKGHVKEDVPAKIAMPDWNVFVCHSGSDVKHDDTTIRINVVAISKTAKFLLTRGIPNVENQRTAIRCHFQRTHFDTDRGCRYDLVKHVFVLRKLTFVFLFEFATQVSFDERCFAWERMDAYRNVTIVPVPPSPTRTSLNDVISPPPTALA